MGIKRSIRTTRQMKSKKKGWVGSVFHHFVRVQTLKMEHTTVSKELWTLIAIPKSYHSF